MKITQRVSIMNNYTFFWNMYIFIEYFFGKENFKYITEYNIIFLIKINLLNDLKDK